MSKIEHNCILLRYGEIGLKSRRTRPWFEKRYVKCIKNALARSGVKAYTIKNLGARYVVYTSADVLNRLQRVAGIQSVSPAIHFTFESKQDILNEIKKYNNLVENKTFGAKVRRVGNQGFNSQELAKEIGDTLYEFSKGVNLTNPDVFINLEIRDNNAYLFTESFEGVGGLPIDSSQPVLCLFSGGMDSPVAAYQLMKRGCAVDFVFINMQGDKSLHEASKVYNYLVDEYWHGYTPRFFHVDAKEVVKRIMEVPDRLRQIVLKVAFYQIANSIEGYTAIGTGEALSQKSSQTLQSLAVLNTFSEKIVLRPVIGMDKIEVMDIAQKIGTYAASQKVTEYCGISKGAVTTVPKLEEIQEHIVNVSDVKIETFKGIINLKLVIDVKVTEGIVVDIRDEYIQEEDPLGGLSYKYPDVLSQLDKFDKEKEYIITCTFGVKSDEVAFSLRKKGVKAISMSTAAWKIYLKKEEMKEI